MEEREKEKKEKKGEKNNRIKKELKIKNKESLQPILLNL